MKRFLFLIGFLVMLLSACAGSAKNPPPHQEPVPWPTGPWDNPFPQIKGQETKFTLTDTQQALFDAYSKDFNFDISLLKGVSPMDVAHVFIECGIEGYWEGEYNLFYFDTKTVAKEEYKSEYEQDIATRDLRSRRAYADILLPFLKDGTFIDDGNGSGHIEFNSYENTADYEGLAAVKSKMHFKQVNGIWMIDQNNMFDTE